MTEAEWLACADLETMLKCQPCKASARKQRLFAVACGRRVAHLVPEQDSRAAVETAERYADGHLDKSALTEIIAATEATARAGKYGYVSFFLPRELLRISASHSASYTAMFAASLVAAEGMAQLQLLREVFGNPFRPVPRDPAWLTPAVSRIAQGAYEDRHLESGELDLGTLAVLADALEDASYSDRAILDHLRGPGPHVRGCWALDLVLGKS